MVCYAALVLWYQSKLVAFLPLGESCTFETVPVTSNSVGRQYPVTCCSYKHSRKCLSRLIFPTLTHTVNFLFSLFTFHFTFTYKISHDITAHILCLFCHHC